MCFYKKNTMSCLFCVVVLTGVLAAGAGVLLGTANPYCLFYGNKWDMGMDFFNPIYAALVTDDAATTKIAAPMVHVGAS